MPLFPQLDKTPGAIKRTAEWLEPAEGLALMRAEAVKAGRDPAAIGLEGRITYVGEEPAVWRSIFETHRANGAGYVTVMMQPGLVKGVDAVLAALERVKRAVAA
jgi:hypothetical protein